MTAPASTTLHQPINLRSAITDPPSIPAKPITRSTSPTSESNTSSPASTADGRTPHQSQQPSKSGTPACHRSPRFSAGGGPPLGSGSEAEGPAQAIARSAGHDDGVLPGSRQDRDGA